MPHFSPQGSAAAVWYTLLRKPAAGEDGLALAGGVSVFAAVGREGGRGHA